LRQDHDVAHDRRPRSPDDGQPQDLRRRGRHAPAEKTPVNTVFQNYALFPHMSVEQNIAFGLKMQRVKKNEISRYRSIIERLGIRK
jgi:ABC-type Fe3+/spermidine/putrescine transport system ATPase subunit